MIALVGRKISERKFAVPTSAAMLALVNDSAKLGFGFKTIALVVASSLIYSGIEAVCDIARMKYQGKEAK